MAGDGSKRKKINRATPWKCLKCDEAIDEESPSIECGMCKQWVHKKCTNLSNDKYKLLQKGGEEIIWACEKCRGRGDEGVDRSRIEVKVDKMMEMMTVLTQRLLSLEDEKDLDAKVEKKVNEALGEMMEREKRKLSIVIVNIPESEGETVDARNKKDKEKVVELVKKVTGLEDVEILSPLRLGARPLGSKPRLLRVSVTSDEVKKKIMTNARKLNENVNDPKKRVYFNHDRTPKEREDFRQLRSELSERQKFDPELIIRGGKIVKRTMDEKKGRKHEKEVGTKQTNKKPVSESDSETDN